MHVRLRVYKPKSLFGCMNLATGVELITWFAIINRMAGLYGLLALVAGAQLSGWQVSLYIYSLLALGFNVYMLSHIRKETLLPNIYYAYFYAIDTLISTLYTALFSVEWFLRILDPEKRPLSSAGDSMAANEGGLNPEYNVTEVHVVASPHTGDLIPGQEVTAVGVSASNGSESATTASMPDDAENTESIVILVFLLLIKLYFLLAVLSYTRYVLLKAHPKGRLWENHGFRGRLLRWMAYGSFWQEDSDDESTRRPSKPYLSIPSTEPSDVRY